MREIERETLGSFIAACLHAHDVRTVFGIPGTHNIEIYRGLRKYGISHVLTRHEQGATYAADGYARSSGRPGVVIATSGPGVTNCVTGIANAYADSVPLLVISPGVPRGQERRELGFLHEAKDQRAGIAQFAQDSVRAESGEAVAQAINEIFMSFTIARPRPYHLEIPTDIIEMEVQISAPEAWQAALPSLAADSAKRVVHSISVASRPIVIAGGGARGEGERLRTFAERFGLPVATTVQGKGTLCEHHELSLGAVAGGSGGFAPLAEADLVIALGTELKNADISPRATLIRCDVDPKQLHKHHTATVALQAHVGAFLESVLKIEAHVSHDKNWLQRLQQHTARVRSSSEATWSKLHDAVLSAARRNGSRAVVTGDSSQISWLGTVASAKLRFPEQFITTDGYATLGYGVPAAIGAKIADPDASVVALLGDGAFMFSVQELMTASEQGLSIPIVVLDNGGYEEIYQNMRSAKIEPYAVKLKQPNYRDLASGMGCGFESVRTPEQLERAVAEACDVGHPTVIHVHSSDFENDVWRGRNTRER